MTLSFKANPELIQALNGGNVEAIRSIFLEKKLPLPQRISVIQPGRDWSVYAGDGESFHLKISCLLLADISVEKFSGTRYEEAYWGCLAVIDFARNFLFLAMMASHLKGKLFPITSWTWMNQWISRYANAPEEPKSYKNKVFSDCMKEFLEQTGQKHSNIAQLRKEVETGGKDKKGVQEMFEMWHSKINPNNQNPRQEG